MTSVPKAANAKDINSFAYKTFTQRWPVILVKCVDSLYRFKDSIVKKYDNNPLISDELKIITNGITQMRYELTTNKPITPIEDNLSPDSKNWNISIEEYKESIENANENFVWFSCSFLFAECYMYRRIHDLFLKTTFLKDFDIFKKQKQEAFYGSQVAILALAQYAEKTFNSLQEKSLDEKQIIFSGMLQVCLWGNRCDLSISAMSENHQKFDALASLTNFSDYALVNDTKLLWNWFTTKSISPGEIHFILDNAGYELFSDLCFADLLLYLGFANKIVFHPKQIPWFVSDVTPSDFSWTLQKLSEMNNIFISKLSQRWNNYLQSKTWTLHHSYFWTGPYAFSDMKRVDSELSDYLSGAKLLIFKGDLNYRKLIGDLLWDYTTDYATALREFTPTSQLALRTLKAEVVVGLKAGQAEQVAKCDSDWMFTGQYGVIQSYLK